MKQIKVLRVITRLNIGGPAIQAVMLSAGLDKDRFSSLLVTGTVGKKEGDMSYLAAENGIEPLVITELQREPNIVYDIVSFYKLYKFIKREKPDVVHTHTSKAGTLGRVAARLAGVPLIIHTFHGHTFHSYFNLLKNRLFLATERVLAGMTDKIVVISESQKEKIKGYLNLNTDERLVLIPLGFDLSKFLSDDLSNKRDKFRRELDIPEEAIVIGIIGRLTAIKNHRMFIEAARMIKQKSSGKTVKFLIIGDGELKKELTVLSNRLGIRKDVIFAGWRKDVDSLYKAADIIALTSLNEGTPVSLIEAFASAKAAVATDVGGVRDIVEDGKSGFVVPPNDIDAFSDAITTLINDKERRESFGLYGREFVKNTYTKERLIRDIENLYEKEMRRKRPVSR